MPSTAGSAISLDAIVGSSEMARIVRQKDWSATPLGVISGWSDTLISHVNMVLCSPLPATLSWGEELTFIYNDAAIPTLGERHPAALGCSYREVFKDAWHLVGPELEECFFDGKSIVRENVSVPLLREGVVEEGYYTYALVPIHEKGKVVGVYDPYQNTTREVEAEKELRRRESKFRTFVEAVSDVVYRVSADWSHALEVEGRGFLPDTRTPDPDWFTRNVHPADQERVRSGIRSAIQTESVFEMEHMVRRLDGTAGWTFSRAIPVREEGGRIVEWFGAATDITARKLAEQALLQTEKLAAVGRLASSIAHEINNPLESVTNLLYLVQGSSSLEEIQAYVDTAERELRRVSLIANQALRFNKQATRQSTVSCKSLMEDTITMLQAKLMKNRIAVEQRHSADQQVQCLAGEIRQVLNNLIGNAIDSMPLGGRLLLRTRKATNFKTEQSGVVLTVADTGTGMPSEVKQRVFDAFYTTKGSKGTGLGLWISAEIVAKHNGSLALRSRTTRGGSGTVFRVFLPSEEKGRMLLTCSTAKLAGG